MGKVKCESKQKLLEQLYIKQGSSSLLSSCEHLYAEAIKSNPEITVKDVNEYLKGKDSYTLMVEKKKRFKREKFRFPKPGNTLCADVAYLNEMQEGKWKFLLFCMDGFSRYLWITPLKSLKQKDVIPSLEKILKNSIYDYSFFFSDMGKEFFNRGTKTLFEKYKIKQYHIYSEDVKCSIVERAIKTIKIKFSKFIIEFNNLSIIKNLDKIVDSYNITPHRGLLYETPLDVFLMVDHVTIQNFTLRINRLHKKQSSSLTKVLSIGTVVRLSASRKKFPRAIYMQNTTETFIVTKVLKTIPVSYVVKDTSDNILKGVFYREELTPIIQKNTYPIQVLKRRKVGKKVEFLVKWIGYPCSENTWISKTQMSNISDR